MLLVVLIMRKVKSLPWK